MDRDDRVGSVKRKAAGYADGVDGLEGGKACSKACSRLVEFVCMRARDVAVAAE